MNLDGGLENFEACSLFPGRSSSSDFFVNLDVDLLNFDGVSALPGRSLSKGFFINFFAKCSPVFEDFFLTLDFCGLVDSVFKGSFNPFSRFSLASFCERLCADTGSKGLLFRAGLPSRFSLCCGLSLFTVYSIAWFGSAHHKDYAALLKI